MPPRLTDLLHQAAAALGSQLMSTAHSLIVHNGHAFPLADCPLLPIEQFRQEVVEGIAAGGAALGAFCLS